MLTMILFNAIINPVSIYGGVAQLARAPALQAGGHRFDSVHLHQKKNDCKEIIEEAISLQFFYVIEKYAFGEIVFYQMRFLFHKRNQHNYFTF